MNSSTTSRPRSFSSGRRTIYLFKLPGLSRKVRVAIGWTLDLFFPRDLLQLKVSRTDRLGRQHYEAGQTILSQGDVGDAFYAIVKGECEILHVDAEGVETCVARLGMGQHFGEEALLTGKVRSATVRAVTPVDVVVLGRDDFMTLRENLFVVRDAFARSAASEAEKTVGS
jgi:CRP-like cAMP-binding protein